ncbi:type IV secretion system protein, partial [Escherichia coli]|nr:type IV secretion system protein [Escherichia coli]ELM0574038.1 type IV secretion system protein [Escherichia coli]EMC1485172.1 type IV secretion system protein [Escherichia coli]
MNVVSEFITTINTVVQSGAASNAAKIAKAISPVFVAAVLLYIVYVAYEITYSQRDIILSEVTKLIASLSLVGAFTYTAPYYSQYVIPFVMHAGSDLSNALTGTGDVATSVDGLWEKLSTIMDNFISSKVQELSMTDIGGYIGAYAIWGIGYAGGAILILYTTIFLCISTFMVGLLLATGIIFICFSFFPTTRSMFTSWCGSCLNYILLNVFYTISFGFVVTLIEKNMVKDGNVTIMMVVTLLLVILISVFLIEQIGTLCSTLTGGVGINGLTSAANGAGGKLAGSLGRVTGTRAFMNGFKSNMSNPFFNAGQSLASKMQQSST